MPCFYPLQAVFAEFADGKRKAFFPQLFRDRFRSGKPLPSAVLSVPCGRCMGCRLERSRQVALRCLHESKLYEHNCFVTLTFDDEHLVKQCPLTEGGYSLVRKHTQDFMKRLREKFRSGFDWVDRDRVSHFCSFSSIRVFGCGEYGDRLFRPHYHLCLFNCYFPDQVKWSKINGFWHYNSAVLSSLWTFGHATVTDFSFETAAYVGRYCTKKVTGDLADRHYAGRLPEFSIFSNRPGLGKAWFVKFGKSDVLPTDSCVVRRAICKPPRYYDKLRERDDPEAFLRAKEIRVDRAMEKVEDNSYARLLVKEKCMDARIRLLVRKLE